MKYKNYDIELIRSRRKTIAIEIYPDLHIKVRAPLRTPQYRIMEFLEEKEHWIDLHLEKMRQRQKSNADQTSRTSISEEERIIKVCEGLPNLLRGFREGFTIKTA